MSLIRFNNVTKRYDSRPVLRDVFFRLAAGEKVGLIGKNGTGKTTVLRLMLGQEAPTEGTLDVSPGVSIGYFSQFSELTEELTIPQILAGCFTEIRRIEEELARIDDALAAAADEKEQKRALERQAALLDDMERLNGWNWENEVDTVLTKLGFSDAHRRMPVAQLSGGWRNRAALARILIQKPAVLLLDEPTNYLDVEGLAWLENWLQKYRGALVVVSHDRHFLDAVVGKIVEIENYHFQVYEGNFTYYVREKKTRLRTLEQQFEHEEELLALEAEAIAERRAEAKDPSLALKRKLANIGKQVAPRPVERIVTDLYQGLTVKNVVCRAEGLAKSLGGRVLFRNVSFEIGRDHRLAIIGPNGCGKTTLVRTLVGETPPDAGAVEWCGSGSSSPYCYYNDVFDRLDAADTVTHAVNTAPLAFFAPRKAVHRFLALLQFSEADIRQRIGALSGGQKARVALALALLSGAPCLVLDEPTNYLDLTSTQVMERALAYFPGAVIVISHDRFFIDKVATRLLVFQGGGDVAAVEGNWTIWQASGQDRRPRRSDDQARSG